MKIALSKQTTKLFLLKLHLPMESSFFFYYPYFSKTFLFPCLLLLKNNSGGFIWKVKGKVRNKFVTLLWEGFRFHTFLCAKMPTTGKFRVFLSDLKLQNFFSLYAYPLTSSSVRDFVTTTSRANILYLITIKCSINIPHFLI